VTGAGARVYLTVQERAALNQLNQTLTDCLVQVDNVEKALKKLKGSVAVFVATYLSGEVSPSTVS